MSHFTVLVVGEDPEKKLAPFHQFECTGEDNEYVQEIDKTEEARESYKKDTQHFYQSPDGALHGPYDDQFYRDPTSEEREKIGPIGGMGCGHGLSWSSRDWNDGLGYRTKVHFLPEGWVEVERPVSDVKSFAEFVEYHYDYEPVAFGNSPDFSNGHKYGYVLLDQNGEVVKVVDRTNPNYKWDWYQLGGRWNGYFRLKPNTTGVLGDQSLVAPRDVQPGFTDQCKKSDIDLVVMRAEARMKAIEKYDKFQVVLAGRDLPPRWSEILDKHPNNIDAARKEYGDISVVRDIRKADLDPWGKDIVDVYGVSKEEFCQRAEDACFSTFAIIDNDGKWHEKGEMGMFGMAFNEKCQDDWNAVFRAFFDAIPDDMMVSVYDCHI